MYIPYTVKQTQDPKTLLAFFQSIILPGWYTSTIEPCSATTVVPLFVASLKQWSLSSWPLSTVVPLFVGPPALMWPEIFGHYY